MKHVLSSVLFGALILALAPVALADWDHEVKWNQLEPYTATFFDLQPSYVNTTGTRIVADDFDCSETGYITDVEFYGTCPNLDSLAQFRITFWDGVPGDASDDGHPGTLEGEAAVDPANAQGVGWQIIDQGVGDAYLFKINLAVDNWFVQEEDNTYWIGIQGVFLDTSKFNWCCRSFGAATNGDDAVTGDLLVPPSNGWEHLVWVEAPFLAVVCENDLGSLGNPPVLQSADMSFKLTGTAIPEPATVALLCAAGVLFLRRCKRKR